MGESVPYAAHLRVTPSSAVAGPRGHRSPAAQRPLCACKLQRTDTNLVMIVGAMLVLCVSCAGYERSWHPLCPASSGSAHVRPRARARCAPARYRAQVRTVAHRCSGCAPRERSAFRMSCAHGGEHCHASLRANICPQTARLAWLRRAGDQARCVARRGRAARACVLGLLARGLRCRHAWSVPPQRPARC